MCLGLMYNTPVWELTKATSFSLQKLLNNYIVVTYTLSNIQTLSDASAADDCW